MITLTIDPSGMGKSNHPAGWCLHDGKRTWGQVRPKIKGVWTDEVRYCAWRDAILDVLFDLFPESSLCYAVNFATEDQFFGRNGNSSKGLTINREMWYHEAWGHYMQTHPAIDYNTWAYEVCGIRRGTKSADAKAAYILHANRIATARELQRNPPMTEHIAAAICMGEWLRTRLTEAARLEE